jgi:PIN domain-containing protein
MAVRKRKSRKLFGASSPSPPDKFVFFTDAKLGRRVVPEALRAVGEEVKAHDELFSPGIADRVWLDIAGEKKRIVLTKDAEIQYHHAAINAFLAARVRAFVLVGKNLPGAEMGRIFVKALPEMKKLCESQQDPFVAKVDTRGLVEMIKRKRFSPSRRS